MFVLSFWVQKGPKWNYGTLLMLQQHKELKLTAMIFFEKNLYWGFRAKAQNEFLKFNSKSMH